MSDFHANLLPPMLRAYALPRGTMQAVIGGRSAIDLPKLDVTDAEQARAFLLRYGYDICDQNHVELIEKNRAQSLGFIRGVLLARVDLEVPDWLDEIPVIELLLTAATGLRSPDRLVRLRQAWACALLRVMHTFAHAENHFQHAYYPQIRESILNRFVEQVGTRDDGSPVLHGRETDVPLVRFEVKEAKPPRSVVLKLLHKAENVATDLFDHIGVRIVVERPADALFAVRALLNTHTIMFANIKPTRSRNTLVDVDALSQHVNNLARQVEMGQMSEVAAASSLATFKAVPPKNVPAAWNIHSSARYRSIQFTCRQMIRLTNPVWARMQAAQKVAAQHLTGAALAAMQQELSLSGVEREIQFFFPYEVQIMDRASQEEATQGRASYREYKRRQVTTVRGRVLGRVLDLEGRNPADEPRRLRQTVPLVPLRELLAGS
ncbi:MAG: TIGR04552 family protein [Myxococcales bacterium]|nr:TIGR04552 family protein [Myxococcales bacterium]